MATTAQVSDQITNSQAIPITKNNVVNIGKLRLAYFSFTQSGAGDANSTVDLHTFGSGRIKIYPSLSRLKSSAFGAGRTLNIGDTGYTKVDGTAVSADADFLVDGRDVSSAADAVMGDGTNADFVKEIETKNGLTIQAIVLGSTIPDGATVEGWLAYVRD